MIDTADLGAVNAFSSTCAQTSSASSGSTTSLRDLIAHATTAPPQLSAR